MDNTTIIKRLNELFEEAILNCPDEEVLQEIKQNPDPSFDKHLKYIRKRNAQAKASIQKSWFTNAKEELDRLMNEIGNSEFLQALLAKPEYQKVLALHSKYEGMSQEDEEAALIEKKLLELVKVLKNELENEENSSQ